MERPRAGALWLLLFLFVFVFAFAATARASAKQVGGARVEVEVNGNRTASSARVKSSNQESDKARAVARFKRRRDATAAAAGSLAPDFDAPIGNVSAVLGRDVRLVCSVKNLGQHQVAWLKEETKTILSIDTNIIITNYRIFLIPDEEARKWVLHIKDVQESDRGFYRCQVNTNPMISALGHLEVVVPASLIEAESSQLVEVVEGGNASLQCKASGHPRPTISWRREDGAPIRLTGSGATAQTGEGQAGLSGADLSQAASGEDGERLRKRAAGEPPERASLSQLSDVRADKLALTRVDRTMAGLYVCSASNGIPSQVSRQIPLYVKFPPRATIVQRPSVSVALGEPLELECLIEAFPRPTSYWSGRQIIGGAPSTSGPRSAARWLLHTSGAALGRPIKTLGSGGFQLLAGAPLGGSTSGLAATSERLRELNQLRRRQAAGAPLDPSELANANDDDDQPATLEFQRHANPIRLARVRALVTSEPERESEKEQQQAFVTVKQSAVSAHTHRLRLTIARVRPGDLGDYVCVASNSLGTASARVQVRGRGEEQQAAGAQQRPAEAESELGAGEREQFQRDSLASTDSAPLANSQVWAGQLGQAGAAASPVAADPSGQQAELPAAARRQPNYARQTNRVYDENYLQAIRNRQAAGAAAGLHAQAAGKLQQKLKMAPHGEPARSSAAPNWRPRAHLAAGLLSAALLPLLIAAA